MVATELEIIQKKAVMLKKYFRLVAEEKAHEVSINDADKILPALTVNCKKTGVMALGQALELWNMMDKSKQYGFQ